MRKIPMSFVWKCMYVHWLRRILQFKNSDTWIFQRVIFYGHQNFYCCHFQVQNYSIFQVEIVCVNIQTYIITTLWSGLQPASHTTHVVYVHFKCEWRYLQFNVDSERQIFEKLFHGRLIYSQSFWKKSAERKLLKKYLFHSAF